MTLNLDTGATSHIFPAKVSKNLRNMNKDFKRFNNPPEDILNLLHEEGINSKILCEDNSNDLDYDYEN